MAETTADVRRDIELTRERMSDTLSQLEQKLNVVQVVKDNPWPALAVAVAAGAFLAGSRSDVKAAAATAAATVGATKGASNKIGEMLDDVVASLVGGFHGAFESKLEGWVNDLKSSLGATNMTGSGSSRASAQLGAGNGSTPTRSFSASSPTASDSAGIRAD